MPRTDALDPTGWPEPDPWRIVWLDDREHRHTIVDWFTWEWARKHLWFANHDGGGAYYACTKISGTKVYLHKAILALHGPNPPSSLHIVGDHVSGNTLDNRLQNLRWATETENKKNQHRRNRDQICSFLQQTFSATLTDQRGTSNESVTTQLHARRA